MQYIVHEKQGDSISTADSLDYKAICVSRQGISEVTTSVVVIDEAYVDHLERHQPYSARYICILYWQLSAPILNYWTNHDCQRSRFPSVSLAKASYVCGFLQD